MLGVNLNTIHRALSYLTLVLLVVLNTYVLMTESYVGDFTKLGFVRVYPPFRFETRVATYDIETGRVNLFVSHGLLFSVTVLDRDVDLIRVKSYGLDLFILVSTIFIVAVFYATARRGLKGLRGLLTLTLPLVVIALNFIYVYSSSIPLSKAIVTERNEPLFCEEKFNYTFCMLDVLNHNSRIMVSVENESILILLHGVTSENIVVNKTVVKEVLVKGENTSVWILSVGKPKLIYRRISFIEGELRHGGLIEALTVSSIGLKAVNVALIKRLE